MKHSAEQQRQATYKYKWNTQQRSEQHKQTDYEREGSKRHEPSSRLKQIGDGASGEGEAASRCSAESQRARRLRWLRESSQPSLPKGREERLRVHTHGGRRVGSRQVHPYQLNVLIRHLQSGATPRPVIPREENRECRDNQSHVAGEWR